MRLQHAAGRLVDRSAKVLDVALDAGFGDVSNFNHAFKREFGVNPRAFWQRPDRDGSAWAPGALTE